MWLKKYLASELIDKTFYKWCIKYARVKVQFKSVEWAKELSDRTCENGKNVLFLMYMGKRTARVKNEDVPPRTDRRWIMAFVCCSREINIVSIMRHGRQSCKWVTIEAPLKVPPSILENPPNRWEVDKKKRTEGEWRRQKADAADVDWSDTYALSAVKRRKQRKILPQQATFLTTRKSHNPVRTQKSTLTKAPTSEQTLGPAFKNNPTTRFTSPFHLKWKKCMQHSRAQKQCRHPPRRHWKTRKKISPTCIRTFIGRLRRK